jgi:hypothetical protein
VKFLTFHLKVNLDIKGNLLPITNEEDYFDMEQLEGGERYSRNQNLKITMIQNILK